MIEAGESRKATSLAHGTKASGASSASLASNLGFTPDCDLKDKDAISAVTRASSQECKRELVSLACRLQSKSLFPKRLPSFCHLKGNLAHS